MTRTKSLPHERESEKGIEKEMDIEWETISEKLR
jgi:hypothetical protein